MSDELPEVPAPPKTVRMQILEAMKDSLMLYDFNTIEAPAVFVGRVSFDTTTDPLPLITIVPGLDTAAPVSYGGTAVTLPISVSALVSTAGGEGAAWISESVLGDLHQSVLASAPILGSHIVYTGGGVDTYPDTPSGPFVITVTATFDVAYDHYFGNPFVNDDTVEEETEPEETEPEEGEEL